MNFMNILGWAISIIGILGVLGLIALPFAWLYQRIKEKSLKNKVPEEVKREVENVRKEKEFARANEDLSVKNITTQSIQESHQLPTKNIKSKIIWPKFE
jgi:hypothetical protein